MKKAGSGSASFSAGFSVECAAPGFSASAGEFTDPLPHLFHEWKPR